MTKTKAADQSILPAVKGWIVFHKDAVWKHGGMTKRDGKKDERNEHHISNVYVVRRIDIHAYHSIA